jgi:LacI family transcriptional regulator
VKKRVTIDDIARAAQVSKSTVSRVLNDTTPVAAEKERAVLAAVAALDYKPNIFARGLAGGLSMTVGVLTHHVGSPFYDAIMSGIISELSGSRYSPIFADGRWQKEIEERALQTLLGRHVDGVIIVGGTLPAERLLLLREQVPVVIAARQIPGLAERCLHVDNEQAAHRATQYLIEAGHRRIAHIAGPAEHEDALRRRAGYERALSEAQIPFNAALVVHGNFRRQSGILAVEALLTRGESFTAIFCGNDQMAFGARLALYRRGIRVPEDVSLVGFDDQPVSAFMTPPLTTVRQPALEIGHAAAQAMLQLLNDQPFAPPELNTRLIVRESTARLR